ncbi:MAG TPA: threonine ammonia-lyase [Thermodesulfovibrionales bacterium]|nr:threonine ammonia-lyase [Thermodesulfovibrionales bacterium]
MITIEDIRRAHESTRRLVHKTPLIYSRSLSAMSGAEVYLKAENLQKTGSFKVRGALNRMQSLRTGKVIAASLGNHAQGVAFAAARLGLTARIVMPLTAPLVKEEATRGYGADVVLHGENLSEALTYALSQKDYVFIHPFDDDLVIAGQGTIGLEVLEDLEHPDYILVPVGGGGLISGIATAVKSLSPETAVVGVQTESALSALASFRGKKVVERPPSPTLADGIAVGRICERTLALMNRYVDDLISAAEASLAPAILLFLERKKLMVEGAGAVPLAALLANPERFKEKRVVLVISGGNIDSTLIDRIIHKGLLAGGRVGVFTVIADDIPGSLQTLTAVIAARRGNILDVVHERYSYDLPVGKTGVVFTVETRGKGHLDAILADLTSKGFEIRKKI